MSRLRAEYHQQQHEDLGECLRWFKAFYCQCYNPVTQTLDPGCPHEHDQNGRVYVEQPVASSCKVLVSQTRQPMTDPDFGIIQPGALRISVMPNEIPLARFDHVILTQRQLVARPVLLRQSGTLLDSPINTPVVAVQNVRQAATTYQASVDWGLTGDHIEWLAGGSRPVNNTNYTVEHTYNPTYIFLGLEEDAARPDANGVLLPLRGVLMQIP